MCCMSMNAQVMKVVKDGKVIASFKASQMDEVVFEEVQASTTIGTATRTGGVEVTWVQLWENGPKFAEYNVGATSETQYGGYYCWGMNIDKDPDNNYYEGANVLTGAYDTATKLWGSNWRMPTQEEFQALLKNCDATWTEDYNGSGIAGCIFTGKGEYLVNSIFLPAAGVFQEDAPDYVNFMLSYWSSTPEEEDYAYTLMMMDGYKDIMPDSRGRAYSVRAVLAE